MARGIAQLASLALSNSRLMGELDRANRVKSNFVATMSKRKRAGRIFIDWLRNERGATAVVPYSIRARPGAPVAVPVTWDELETLKSARAFSVSDVEDRLREGGRWRPTRVPHRGRWWLG